MEAYKLVKIELPYSINNKINIEIIKLSLHRVWVLLILTWPSFVDGIGYDLNINGTYKMSWFFS